MPELPEVEVTRLSFAKRILGASIEGVRLGKPLRWPLGVPTNALVGLRVGAAIRRGKYIWLPLYRSVIPADGGDFSATGGLLLHLGMSGSLAFHTALGPPGVHDHFDLITSLGTLRLTDPRRFGAVIWSPSLVQEPAAKLLATLGREPFDPALTGADLHRAWQGRKVSIKEVLLAGHTLVGAGNIYACEALFRAGINPRLACGKLSLVRCQRLLSAVREILGQAIDAGGSSLRDFRDATGHVGAFQTQTQVYGREGELCIRCGPVTGQRIRRIIQGQRSTFFCSACQRR